MLAQASQGAMKSLERKPAETWRDAEARMILLTARMLEGKLPRLEDFSEEDQRRLGYLAEFAALIVGAPNEAELLGYAEQARRLTSSRGGQGTCALVPGGSTPRWPSLDALASEWGFHPGLDVSRYRSEAPALLLETA